MHKKEGFILVEAVGTLLAFTVILYVLYGSLNYMFHCMRMSVHTLSSYRKLEDVMQNKNKKNVEVHVVSIPFDGNPSIIVRCAMVSLPAPDTHIMLHGWRMD